MNDKTIMTKPEAQVVATTALVHLCFVIHSSFGIRHSDF
jgi:hypothetical protein